VDFHCAQRGETPLLQAAYKGHLDMCKLLVERGADKNLQDKVHCLLWSLLLHL
jgi:ankyrin repeat protein